MAAQAARAGNARTVALAAENRLAPAKVNLALHVTGRRPDGYHLLSSLVAFADVGDRLSLAPAEAEALALSGPFADVLSQSLSAAAGGNSIVAALALVRALLAQNGGDLAPHRVLLEKNLPVASGIGGGSADAAAILCLAAAACPDLGSQLLDASVRLGADVPMCVDGRAALVSGIGEAMRPLAHFPVLPAVLVNPGFAVSTPRVFAALARRDSAPLPEPPRFAGLAGVLDYLGAVRNDLEAPARSLVPAIGDARSALEASGARLARMSGSGASVFGLFATRAEAERAGAAIARAEPSWWVRPTVLGPAVGNAP